MKLPIQSQSVNRRVDATSITTKGITPTTVGNCPAFCGQNADCIGLCTAFGCLGICVAT